jgi:DNA replication protein DnaC
VVLTSTDKLVQQLLAAKQALRLDPHLRALDRYALVILTTLGYAQQGRVEMEVLFTLLAGRCERRTAVVSSNLVFSKGGEIFKDPMTTMAAIERLVHHALVLEFNGESVRARHAKERGPEPSREPVSPWAPPRPWCSTDPRTPSRPKGADPIRNPNMR